MKVSILPVLILTVLATNVEGRVPDITDQTVTNPPGKSLVDGSEASLDQVGNPASKTRQLVKHQIEELHKRGLVTRKGLEGVLRKSSNIQKHRKHLVNKKGDEPKYSFVNDFLMSYVNKFIAQSPKTEDDDGNGDDIFPSLPEAQRELILPPIREIIEILPSIPISRIFSFLPKPTSKSTDSIEDDFDMD